MESFFLMEDAARRREYVQEIRRSFDRAGEETEESWSGETGIDEMTAGWVFFKIRLLAAVALFLGFLFVKYNQLEVYGYGEDEIGRLCRNRHSGQNSHRKLNKCLQSESNERHELPQ